MIYDLIAPIYDKINGEIDYSLWADFIEKIVKEHYTLGTPELVLDLGCGTGRMTRELASRGYDMTGVDYSAEMLDIARGKAEQEGLRNILWLCQDMRSFELYGTVELVVSCLDCINHITKSAELSECFRLVHNYLSPEGLFVFDINGKYKFENIYSDRAYVMEEGGDVCIWQNSYDPGTRICDFYITLFSENTDGSYDRHDEMQREKMYTLRAIRKLLSDNSLELVGAYSDFSFTPATDADERIYFVARCRK